MHRRGTPVLVMALACAFLLAGCGGPKEVTYVDPNAASGVPNDGLSSEPIRRFGAAAAERAKAVIRIRAALAAARTLAAASPADAASAVSRAVEEDLPFIEPRVHSGSNDLARSLRQRLEQLRDTPPVGPVAYARAVRTLADTLLVQASDIAVPVEARQDVGFRAAMLYETLQQAGMSYEAAFEGSTDEISATSEYRLAYGLLIDASTRQLEAVPEDRRTAVRSALDRIARSSLPGPTPPDDPRDPETVFGELATLAEDVARAAAIDPTWPAPDPATPDQLRSLRRAVVAAVEAGERGDTSTALQQLTAAERSDLAASAAGVAAVSPMLLAQLERDLAITLPAAVSRGDAATAAAEVDAHIDEAIQLVEEELELLREAE